MKLILLELRLRKYATRLKLTVITIINYRIKSRISTIWQHDNVKKKYVKILLNILRCVLRSSYLKLIILDILDK